MRTLAYTYKGLVGSHQSWDLILLTRQEGVSCGVSVGLPANSDRLAGQPSLCTID